jgi:chaperone modulatory protein CbpM
MSKTTFYIALSELCQVEGISQELIIEVVEYGIAKPAAGSRLSEWTFDMESTHWIKKAIRLNQQLEIDWVATAMVISLMRSKDTLEKENKRLKARLSRFL